MREPTTQKMSALVLLALAVLAGLPGPMASAQSIFAVIVGTVTDSTPAVVPGAKITVTNVRTNERREFTTNAQGNYEINNLFPGVYMLEVEMAGFAKYQGSHRAGRQGQRPD